MENDGELSGTSFDLACPDDECTDWNGEGKCCVRE